MCQNIIPAFSLRVGAELLLLLGTVEERAGSSTALLEASAPWIDPQCLNTDKGQTSVLGHHHAVSASGRLRRFLQWLSQAQGDKDFPQIPPGSGASCLCSPAPRGYLTPAFRARRAPPLSASLCRSHSGVLGTSQTPFIHHLRLPLACSSR